MALIIGDDVQWGNFKIKVGRSASASKSNLFLTKIFERISDICKVFSVATDQTGAERLTSNVCAMSGGCKAVGDCFKTYDTSRRTPTPLVGM